LSEHWLQLRLNRQGKPLGHYTSSDYRRYINTSLGQFADKPIRTITPTHVEQWWSARFETHRRATIAAYKYLKSLLTWAVKRRAREKGSQSQVGAPDVTRDVGQQQDRAG
jgi:asparagine synthetase B (glutamine-hydrolysing)